MGGDGAQLFLLGFTFFLVDAGPYYTDAVRVRLSEFRTMCVWRLKKSYIFIRAISNFLDLPSVPMPHAGHAWATLVSEVRLISLTGADLSLRIQSALVYLRLISRETPRISMVLGLWLCCRVCARGRNELTGISPHCQVHVLMSCIYRQPLTQWKLTSSHMWLMCSPSCAASLESSS